MLNGGAASAGRPIGVARIASCSRRRSFSSAACVCIQINSCINVCASSHRAASTIVSCSAMVFMTSSLIPSASVYASSSSSSRASVLCVVCSHVASGHTRSFSACVMLYCDVAHAASKRRCALISQSRWPRGVSARAVPVSTAMCCPMSSLRDVHASSGVLACWSPSSALAAPVGCCWCLSAATVNEFTASASFASGTRRQVGRGSVDRSTSCAPWIASTPSRASWWGWAQCSPSSAPISSWIFMSDEVECWVFECSCIILVRIPIAAHFSNTALLIFSARATPPPHLPYGEH